MKGNFRQHFTIELTVECSSAYKPTFLIIVQETAKDRQTREILEIITWLDLIIFLL